MEATAKLMFARISTRKARMVLDMVRGQYVAEAIEQLRFTHKAAAPLVGKLLGSAISNAQRKNESVAMGRATQIQKGMTHITLVVAERED